MLARDHVLSVEHGQQKSTIVVYSTKCNNNCCDNRVLSIQKCKGKDIRTIPFIDFVIFML